VCVIINICTFHILCLLKVIRCYLLDYVLWHFSSLCHIFLANMNSRLLYAIAVPSVCLLSVTFVHPTQPVEFFRNLYGCFWYASPCLLNWALYSTPLSLRQPHSGASSATYDSPISSPITSSSSVSPLCSFITPSLFYSRLKAYLFHKSCLP